MPARVMTCVYSSVSVQEMPEDMILVPQAASPPRVFENTSFQEPVPLEGEFFWGINLPFFKFVAFYNSRGMFCYLYVSSYTDHSQWADLICIMEDYQSSITRNPRIRQES